MNNVERIMVLGDSHGNTEFMVAAMQFARNNDADVVHVVGDFGIWDHIPAGVRFLDDVNELAKSLALRVTFTDGNHENYDSLYALPVDDDGWRRVRDRIWHAPRGHMWRWGALNFLSMGGAHSIDGPGGVWRQARGPGAGSRGPGAGWWPEETITEDDVEVAITTMIDWAHSPYPEVDVMLTHDCPVGIPLPGIRGYPAGEANRELLSKVYEVAQPQLLIHGHYHLTHMTQDRDRGWGETTVVGLSHDMAQGGQFCFIDTDPFTLHPPSL